MRTLLSGLRRLGLAGVLAGVVAVPGWSLLHRDGAPGRDGAPTAPRRTEEPLFCAPGLTEPASQVRGLRAAHPGRLVEVRVEAGDRIERGQVLALLDHAAADAAVAVRAAELTAALARLARLEAGARVQEIAVARARVAETEAGRAEAERAAGRSRRMLPTGAIDQAALDAAETALAVAEARLRCAQAELALLEAGARREELDEARALAEAARGRLAAARADLEDCLVRAPLDGLVVYRFAHPGEQVAPTDPRPLFDVAAPSPLRVRADVDEFDVDRVHVGQRVHATAPAFGATRFPGAVVRIEKTLGRKNFRTETATEKKDAKILEVVVALEADAAARIPLGMPMRVWFAGGAGTGTTADTGR